MLTRRYAWILSGKVGIMGRNVGITGGQVVLGACSHGSRSGKPVLSA